jgi:hypothetical protein
MNPGRWWVPEKVGRCPQTDDPPCRSWTAKGTRSWRTDGREETAEGPRMQQWNKGPKRTTAATSEEGEDIRQDLQEDLDIKKRTVGSWTGLWKVSDWTLWRGGPPPKRKRDCTPSKSRRCRSTEHSRNVCPHRSEKQDNGNTPGPTGTLPGNHSGRASIKRKQWEQLEGNHRENRATANEGEADHRRHKQSPQKIWNGGTPVSYSGRIVLRKEQCGMETCC